jgi:hypothetical protein
VRERQRKWEREREKATTEKRPNLSFFPLLAFISLFVSFLKVEAFFILF